MRKIIALLLFLSFTIALSAQLNKGIYQGFKILKGKDTEIQLMDIHVNSLLAGNTITLSDNMNKPLNGHYHIIIQPNKYITATISKGFPDGEWITYLYNHMSEKASFKAGKYDGEVHQYYYGHEITTFSNGIRQHYIAHYDNGQLKTEYFYKNGKLNGEIKEYNEDGKLVKETTYKEGIKEGKQTEVNHTGYTFISNYINNTLNGEYLELYPNGKISIQGTYDSNGKKTGRWLKYDIENRLIEDYSYLDGNYHGKILNYYKGELVSAEEYNNGKKDGKQIRYRYNNSKQIEEEKNYSNNQLDGLTKYYNTKGLLNKEILYEKGKMLVSKDYDYSTGKLKSESIYSDGQIIKQNGYDQNGVLKFLSLVNEQGSLVIVQEYNTQGKVILTNRKYKKPSYIKLKEDANGIIDIEY